MKRCSFRHFQQRASTLIELMVSMAVVAITGTIIYYILYAGFTLFAKNTAINMAHQEARVAVLQMSRISTPRSRFPN